MKTQNDTQTTEASADAALLDEILADVQAAGKDTSALPTEHRSALLTGLARRLGLNPLSGAVMFLRTNGRETLYVTKAGTDQIAARERLKRETIRGPEVVEIEKRKVVICQVRATHPDGRSEVSTATLALTDPINDLMKCETKGKRRATLSVCGLGLLAEDEIETIPGAYSVPADVAAEPVRTAPPIAPRQPLALPRDNGASPSGAPLPEAAPVDHYDLAAKLLDGAATLPELGAAWRTINREHLGHLGPGEVTALTQAKDARKAALAAQPPAPKPDGDEPPPPGGPKRARKSAAPADATGDAPAGTDGASAGPQAVASWLRSEGDTVAHAAGIDNVDHLEASARRHGRHLASSRWGIASYAARLEALDRSTVGHADRIVTAWCAAGPKAQRRAA